MAQTRSSTLPPTASRVAGASKANNDTKQSGPALSLWKRPLNYERKVAIVVGASRGLGREMALALAKKGWTLVVSAKSTHESQNLPGTIYSVTHEIEAAVPGADVLAIQCNVMNSKDIQNLVKAAMDKFGRIDLVIYNAGAVWWDTVPNTPTKRYDLLHGVNARGAYDMVQTVLPIFLKRKTGRFVLISPPIYSRFFNGKVAYAMTKIAMTALVVGLAKELEGTGVSITALWPATAVESHVTTKLHVPDTKLRKGSICADAIVAIAHDTIENVNGRALIDEDYLREKGVTDFSIYRMNPAIEPERMMPRVFPSLLVAEQGVNHPKQFPDATPTEAERIGVPERLPSKL